MQVSYCYDIKIDMTPKKITPLKFLFKIEFKFADISILNFFLSISLTFPTSVKMSVFMFKMPSVCSSFSKIPKLKKIWIKFNLLILLDI